MRTPRPLPDELQDLIAFGVADARALGVHRGRLDRGGLTRPYRGVRAARAPDTTSRRAHAYSVRLRDGQFFSHSTAAELHGLPLPKRLRLDPLLHVSVFGTQQPPRAKGVVGHRLQSRPGIVTVVDHLPAVTAVEAWCQLGAVLTVESLVAAADHLVRAGTRHPQGVIEQLRETATAVRRTGADRLGAALVLVRPGVRSP
ncbi:MAG: endonuclease domain-containing protein, partial [Amnibacterium sp.]